MPHYRYLIIGGGMTADAAARGIRDIDATGSIGVVSSDPHPPYNRPPLSKALWKGDPVDGIWRRTGEQPGVTLHLARTATGLDLSKNQVVDDHGDTYDFDRLLLATGGSVRRLL
jgi:NAD(P)H-nitrite reductase large subunit